MKKTFNRFLALALALVMVVCMMSMNVFAAENDTTPVAKVGNTEYTTIDAAIANWTNNTTLTLLADVTLSNVITIKSTEMHTLDLGTYTMTAASGKDAIQIENNGRSSAGTALDIKADATNPGGITATGKAVVRTTGKSGVKDRPIIRFYGGVFNASYIVYHSGSNGTNCPQFQFHGGEFNGTIYTNRALNQFYGGTFNGSLMMSVDTSAYTLIAGGTFKQLSNLFMSSLSSDKFTIGSAKGANNGSVCVDENGNYVITTTTPADAEASVASNYNSNNYFYYSTVNTNGMYYEDVYDALAANTTGKVTVFADELDLAGTSFTGTIVVPEGQSLTIIHAPEGLKVEGEVTIVTPVAKIGDTEYATLEEAIEAVPKNTPTTIQLLCDYTIPSTMVGHQYTQDITIDLGGHTLSNNSIVLTAYRSGSTLTVQNGTVKGNASTGSLRATYGGKIVLGDNLTVAGAGGSAVLVYVDNGSVEIAAKNGVAFTGGKQDFKQSTNANNKLNVAASIGRTYFGTLADAIAAAKDGDTVTVQNDIALTKADAVKNAGGYDVLVNVAGKSITLNLNGKTISVEHTVTDVADRIYAVVCVEDGADLTVTGEGKIDVKTDETTPRVAYMFWKRGTTGSLTIENGTFYMNNSEDSIVYTNGSQIVTINGGDFRLDATGTRANGSPWIFNTQGQNERHIMVYGGTFNADVLRQYWIFEAQSYNTGKALVKGEDGIYRFVDAVAYVTDRYYSGNWYTLETGYATLEDAIAACEGPKTNGKKTSELEVVVLLKDITLEDTITIPAGKSVVLDLNGHTISGTCTTNQGSMFTVANTAKLTIKDSVGTGKITYAGNNSTGWIVALYGDLVLESGTLELTGTWSIGFAVDVRPNAWGSDYTAATTFTMNGGKIVSTDGGVRVSSSSADAWTGVSASFIMNGGTIDAAWDGVFVQQTNATWDVLNVTVNGGTIESDLNPIRIHGPAATGYVKGEDCVKIALSSDATLKYTGSEVYTNWIIDGQIRYGGEATKDQILADTIITIDGETASIN